MLDRDHSGGLSINEVELWAKENRPDLGSPDVRKGFEKMDADADGTIQPGEFDSGLSRKSTPSGK
jgi:Ca2+-binding EF-hand superfamily protein